MVPDLLLRHFAIPVGPACTSLEGANVVRVLDAPTVTAASCFSWYLKVFLASGIRVVNCENTSPIDSNGIQTIPFSLLDNCALARGYFHSKYAILEYFRGWTDFGEFVGEPINLATDLPFGSPVAALSHTKRILVIYRHFGMGVFRDDLSNWACVLTRLRVHLEHSFPAILATIGQGWEGVV